MANGKKRKSRTARPQTPYKLVLVEWEDSAQPVSAWQWVDAYEIPESVRCISVGYLIGQNRKTLAVAPNLGDLTSERIQASGIIRVPRASVRRLLEL